jgi:hypothetical protein
MQQHSDPSKGDPTGAFPAAHIVDDFHANSDLNLRPESQHHSLGPNPNMAAHGDHNHRDGKSVPLFEGLSITGSRSTDAFNLSIISLLTALGATDASTP